MLDKIKKLLGLGPKDTPAPAAPVAKEEPKPAPTKAAAAKKRPVKKASATKSTAKRPGRPKKNPEA